MAKKKKQPGKIRLLIQCAFTAISNGHLIGFQTGKIYTGKIKYLCHPGLNCYSCPGALGSCPIGALQAVLNQRQYHLSLYVFGILTVLGTIFGRLICAFLCPFGLFQDLLYKIPFPKKLRKLPGEACFRWLRFAILGIFVILLPTVVHHGFGIGDPWFCKYICPAGTLEAGLPLVLLNQELQGAIGFQYLWKISLLLVFLISSILIYRPFCRYLCPLGAIYGFFNRFAVYRFHIDQTKCLRCGACQKVCKLDIPVWKTPNSVDCIRCGECRNACQAGAIQTSFQNLSLKINQKNKTNGTKQK